jgi:hypothetical protein
MAVTSTKQLTGLLGDVRRTNNFVVTILDVTDNSDLDLVIQQAFLPKVSLNVLELRRGNDALKFAGVASWEGGQITILDTLQRTELDAVLAWFKQTYNWKTREIGIASEYKKAGYISEFAADGRYMRKWPISGMWISNIDPGSLDAAQGEFKQITFTIQIDPSDDFAPVYGTEYDQEPNIND